MTLPTSPNADFTLPQNQRWPPLPLAEWQPTRDTLHLWTQIVGKLKIALAPFQNQLWHTSLALTARGLTTGPLPYRGGVLQADFDFHDHHLRLLCGDGRSQTVSLHPRSVADFYADVMHRLDLLGVTAQINPLPQELPAPIPFDQDTIHASYDPDAARRWWQIMTSAATVMWRQRSWFVGKASPVHFFWGSFDLTATRHNGEPAPPHPERGYIYRVAENEANWAAGFWPGSGAVDYPAFYAYMVPQPDGMPAAAIAPGAAFWHEEMREFLLPYDAVRTEADPEATLMAFLQSSYAACADLAEWNRAALEITEIPRPR